MSGSDVGPVNIPWKIGAGGITREDLIVVGAINISALSWMPILQLNRNVV